MAVVKELFQAYQEGGLPQDGGYIVSVFYHSNSTYTRYELISFGNVKEIYQNDEGLTFQAEGQKIYVLVEPAAYPNRHTEPAYRSEGEKIPYRYKELNDYVTRRQDHLYVGKEPVVSYTSFTVLKPIGHDLAYIFHPTDDVRQTIVEFFRKSLWKQARVPQVDANEFVKLVDRAFGQILIEEGFA